MEYTEYGASKASARAGARDNNYLEAVGKKIKTIRTKKGFLQKEIAEKCSAEKASISRIEKGSTNLSVLTLKKICDAMEVPVTSVFED